MKFYTLLISIIFGLSALPGIASATIISISTDLSGLYEVPSNASPGTGTGTITFDNVTNMLHVEVDFSGLVGTTTAAHIHGPAAPGVNAGVITAFTDFPLAVSSQTYDHTFDMTLASSYSSAFITAYGGTAASAESSFFALFGAGETYLNIHTSMFPGGEIRGNLVPAPVPEPSTFLLLGAGLSILAFFACRKRKE